MAHLSPAYAIPLLLLLFPILAIVRALLSPLKRVPGPFLARFTRLWYLRSVWHGDFEKTDIRLHAQYGPLVRIAPNEYSVDDPDAVKTIYGHGTAFIKSPWYYASGHPSPNNWDLFTDRDGKRHAANRRKVASLYSMTNLVQMEPYVATCTDLLERKLKEFAMSGVAFNLQHWLQCYAFDVIALITLDERFGFLDDGEDKGGLLAALHQYLFYCANVGVYSEWHPIIYKIMSLLPQKAGGAYLRDFTQRELQKRVERMRTGAEKSSKSEGGDFLSKALSLHAADPAKFTMEDVFIACMTNIGAGSDTTSISLSAIVFQLMRDPRCLDKLRNELDDAASQGLLSSPVTFQESQKLPYLQACIKEGLRMHPATGLPLGRVVPKGGAVIAGHNFAEGTVVGVNSWVAHHNTAVFGPDASEFVPERWLGDPQRAAAMDRYFLAFGHGSRTCIGKNISLMEISKLIPELVQHFDFTLVHPEQDLESQNVWFVKQKNLLCRVALRARD